jgi:hypothetical protein
MGINVMSMSDVINPQTSAGTKSGPEQNLNSKMSTFRFCLAHNIGIRDVAL